jgi:uncharacterized protein (TIGR00369 family)
MPPLSTEEKLARFRRIDTRAAFTQWLGVELVACADGHAEVVLPFRPEMTQHNGFLHGALVGFLIDYACAWAAGSLSDGPVVTSQYQVNLIAPGIGERFIGIGDVVKAGKRQVVTRADAFAESGGERKLIAVGSATIMPL